jgi:hypothetical protein
MGKEKKKNVLIKMPLSVYTDIGLKYLNAKLENPNLSKNDFLINVIRQGIKKLEEEGEK